MMKHTNHIKKSRRGTITIEFTVALMIMTMLFVLTISLFYQVGRHNRRQWARQQCLVAANAQLDSLTAIGRAIPDDDWHRLWPHIDCTVKQTRAEDNWQGLIRAEVTVQTHSEGKDIKTTVCRYIRQPEAN